MTNAKYSVFPRKKLECIDTYRFNIERTRGYVCVDAGIPAKRYRPYRTLDFDMSRGIRNYSVSIFSFYLKFLI